MEHKADPELHEPCPRNKRAHGNIPENFDLRKEHNSGFLASWSPIRFRN